MYIVLRRVILLMLTWSVSIPKKPNSQLLHPRASLCMKTPHSCYYYIWPWSTATKPCCPLSRCPLTSSILVAEIWKTPDVAQAYCKADTGHDEIHLPGPGLPLRKGRLGWAHGYHERGRDGFFFKGGAPFAANWLSTLRHLWAPTALCGDNDKAWGQTASIVLTAEASFWRYILRIKTPGELHRGPSCGITFDPFLKPDFLSPTSCHCHYNSRFNFTTRTRNANVKKKLQQHYQ